MARRMVAPINSIKHFVSRTNTGVTGGTKSTIAIAVGTPAPANASVVEVNIGCVIKAIFLELWVIGSGASNNTTQCVMTLEKIPAGQIDPTNAQMLNLMAYPNKNNILQTFQGVLSQNVDGANPISPLRGWFKIPRGKQRMARGDRIVFNIATVSTNIATCGMFIYKEYQ